MYEAAKADFDAFDMNEVHFSVTAFVNKIHSVKVHIDGGCRPYGLIDRKTANRMQLDFLPLKRTVGIMGFKDPVPTDIVKEVAVIYDLDIAGSRPAQQRVFLYVVDHLDGEHGMMLGRPWLKCEDAIVDPSSDTMTIRRTGVTVSNINISEK